VFISANPKVDDQLMGQANGEWVQWYIAFAESPLVIGYNPSSRFVDDLKNKSWYEVLAEPGLKGSGANFLACMFLSWREGFADFRRRGPLPKVLERWLLFWSVV